MFITQKAVLLLVGTYQVQAAAISRRQDTQNGTNTTDNPNPTLPGASVNGTASADPPATSGFDFNRCFVDDTAQGDCKRVYEWTQTQCSSTDSSGTQYNNCRTFSTCKDEPEFSAALDGFVKPYIQGCADQGTCPLVDYDLLPESCRQKYPNVSKDDIYGWDGEYRCERNPPAYVGPDYGVQGSTVPRPYVCLGIGGSPASRDCVAQFCNPLLTLSKPSMDPCYPDTPTLIRGCKACDTGAAFANQYGSYLTMEGENSYGVKLAAYCKQAPYCYADLFANLKDTTTGACAAKTSTDTGTSSGGTTGNTGGSTGGNTGGNTGSGVSSSGGTTNGSGGGDSPSDSSGQPATVGGTSNTSGQTDQSVTPPADSSDAPAASENGDGAGATGSAVTGSTVARPTLSQATADNLGTAATRTANTAFATGTAGSAARSSSAKVHGGYYSMTLLAGALVMYCCI